jgi:uncharacterized protein (TIGR00369 family)
LTQTNPQDLLVLSDMHDGTLAQRMGIEFLEAGPERVVGRMPVEGNTQPYGLLHGGASAVLAETLGSVAAAIHAGPDRLALGIEINATHHRAASSGYVTGVATRLHGGRTTSRSPMSRADASALRASPACCATADPAVTSVDPLRCAPVGRYGCPDGRACGEAQ